MVGANTRYCAIKVPPWTGTLWPVFSLRIVNFKGTSKHISWLFAYLIALRFYVDTFTCKYKVAILTCCTCASVNVPSWRGGAYTMPNLFDAINERRVVTWVRHSDSTLLYMHTDYAALDMPSPPLLPDMQYDWLHLLSEGMRGVVAYRNLLALGGEKVNMTSVACQQVEEKSAVFISKKMNLSQSRIL